MATRIPKRQTSMVSLCFARELTAFFLTSHRRETARQKQERVALSDVAANVQCLMCVPMFLPKATPSIKVSDPRTPFDEPEHQQSQLLPTTLIHFVAGAIETVFNN